MLQDRRIDDVQGFFGAEPWCRRRGKRERERESENEIKKERKSFAGYTRVLKYLSRIRKVGKKRSFPVIVTRKGKNVRYVARR